jgi:hypothetical protein
MAATSRAASAQQEEEMNTAFSIGIQAGIEKDAFTLPTIQKVVTRGPRKQRLGAKIQERIMQLFEKYKQQKRKAGLSRDITFNRMATHRAATSKHVPKGLKTDPTQLDKAVRRATAFSTEAGSTRDKIKALLNRAERLQVPVTAPTF